MNFLFQQYTEVAFWQMAVPWIGLVVFMVLAAWGWVEAVAQKTRADTQEDITMLYERSFLKKQELTRTLNDKVKSLEARICRLTDRQRGKNGRFESKKKD